MPPLKRIPEEALLELNQRLENLQKRSTERKHLIRETAELFGVSESTVYKSLRKLFIPRTVNRRDCGTPRIISKQEMEHYCEVIAAFKLKSRTHKGRQISTSEAIRHLENHGIETSEEVIKVPKNLLKRSTIDRYLSLWHYDPKSLSIQHPAIRFQAKYSNECWQFDLSHSDFKQIEEFPEWIDTERNPTLMLYSVVDDRSGATYQEYHIVYGEDVYAALRFFFNAMSPKNIEGFPFQGIPEMIYMDNGPIAKSNLFKRVMRYLEIDIRCHEPRGKGGRRTEARSKGKVERPFRTVKELHETLYRFHKPKNEKEANEWLLNFVLRYNERDHRSEPHSRIQDWIEKLSHDGLRKMCSWDRYCKFSREQESRIVGSDARVSVNGISYEVTPELADQRVVIWWGLFDNEIYVEFEDKKFGPYYPSAPIPLAYYRSFRKTKAEKRAERIEKLAEELTISREALTQDTRIGDELLRDFPTNVTLRNFEIPNPFEENTFPDILTARLAIADYLGKPIAKLSEDGRKVIEQIVNTTLVKKEIFSMVRRSF